VDTPSERPALPPYRRIRPHLRGISRSPSPGPPSKRQHAATYPRTPRAVDAEGAAAKESDSGADENPKTGYGELPWHFPRNAERRVELSCGDAQSIRGRSAVTQRMVEGVFFWFLSQSVTSRSDGGFWVLSSMTADAIVGAAACLSWGVRLGGRAIKDGMLLRGGMSMMPVRTGRVWWGVVVHDLHKVLPLSIKYMRSSAVLPTCLFGYFSVFREPHRMVLSGNVRFQAGDGLLTDWCSPDFDCIDHFVAKSMGKPCVRPSLSGVGYSPSNSG